MKISKRVREEAAVLCLVTVSDGGFDSCIWTSADELFGRGESDCDAFHLACDALDECFARFSYDHALVEAAALLRDGWSPGDPVEPWKVS